MRRTATVVLAGLLMGAGLTACGDQDGAAAGDVVIGRPGAEVTGDETYVLLPTGRIDLTVGEPVDEVPADDAGDDTDHQAPDGGVFVPVTWKHDPFGEGAVPVALMGAEPQQVEITLVAGGTQADLGSPYNVVGDKGLGDTGVDSMYAAVASADDLRIEVTYDGLTQTLDPASGDRDAGAAEPLYAEPTMGVEAPCTKEGFASGSVVPDVSCVVNAPQRTPYLPGQGWADEGRTWMLVTADITLSGVRVGGAEYDVVSLEPELTLNSEPPLPADELYGRAEPEPTGVRGTWAFEGRAGDPNTLVVGLDLVLDKASGPGPSTRRVQVQQSVDLGAG